MIMSNRSNLSNITINYGTTAVKCVVTHKFFVVIIDEELKFKAKVKHVCNKVSRAIGAIGRISQMVHGT